ncbi:uncharacterized protein LOC111817366 [Octodon degus]|uniref:Uncharacterized protein LOC111817366 n=1 Tax=Octodon degus TaxID=10160 RepID=A0A6P6ENK5_OCTDE|nr:uncharacterized protein LOC111817366 [Octodon degus]
MEGEAAAAAAEACALVPASQSWGLLEQERAALRQDMEDAMGKAQSHHPGLQQHVRKNFVCIAALPDSGRQDLGCGVGLAAALGSQQQAEGSGEEPEQISFQESNCTKIISKRLARVDWQRQKRQEKRDVMRSPPARKLTAHSPWLRGGGVLRGGGSGRLRSSPPKRCPRLRPPLPPFSGSGSGSPPSPRPSTLPGDWQDTETNRRPPLPPREPRQRGHARGGTERAGRDGSCSPRGGAPAEPGGGGVGNARRVFALREGPARCSPAQSTPLAGTEDAGKAVTGVQKTGEPYPDPWDPSHPNPSGAESHPTLRCRRRRLAPSTPAGDQNHASQRERRYLLSPPWTLPKTCMQSRAWWCTPVSPAPVRLRQEDGYKWKTSLGYKVNSRPA